MGEGKFMNIENAYGGGYHDVVHLLWTGGWDSTYRMVELSFKDIHVEPIYVVDPGRGSLGREFSAMDKILTLLRQKEKTKAIFSSLKILQFSDIPVNMEVTCAYQKFHDEVEMGSQHDWIARLATVYPGMEVCIEHSLAEHTPIKSAIEKYGKLIKTPEGYVVDESTSAKDLQLVLGNIVLPVFDLTELDMLQNIKEWGYEDVMSLIWFCHTPIKGKPCGMCNPCLTKIESGMTFLLPPEALRRYKTLKKIKKCFGDKSIAKGFRRIHHLLQF